VLDPNRTGKDATDLEIGLRNQVVGRDEAIELAVQASLPSKCFSHFDIGDRLLSARMLTHGGSGWILVAIGKHAGRHEHLRETPDRRADSASSACNNADT
jgi:hypothetical protein